MEPAVIDHWSFRQRKDQFNTQNKKEHGLLGIMERLPEDIVVDVLSRVPVKTLVQIRFVCKSWYAIISNKKFSKLQLEQSNKTKNADNHKLLIVSQLSPQLILLDYEHDNYCVSKVDYPHVEDTEYYHSSCVGSCNGLFCLRVGDKIVIWNPSINQYKKVPKFCDSGRLAFRVYYGFGYDSISDDYKIVRALMAFGNIKVAIFNLKANSWRSIDYSNYGSNYYRFILGSPNNLLNGSVHWLVMGKVGTERYSILVAFSLAEEKFLEVPMPDVDDINNKFWAMCVFEGCLCLSGMDRVESGVELWVMKEYMVRASWTKLCTVLWESIPMFGRRLVFSPLCSSRDGDIFLRVRHGTSVVKYNIQQKRCISTVFNLEGDDGLIKPHSHVESLVSPHFL